MSKIGGNFSPDIGNSQAFGREGPEQSQIAQLHEPTKITIHPIKIQENKEKMPPAPSPQITGAGAESKLQYDFIKYSILNKIDSANLSGGFTGTVDKLGEAVEMVSDKIGIAEIENGVVKRLSLPLAARKYDLIAGEITKNVSGNLRGMIINKTAGQVVKLTTEVGGVLEEAGKKIEVLKLAIDFAKELPKAVDIYKDTSLTGEEKTAKIGALATQVAARSLIKSISTDPLKMLNTGLKLTKFMNPAYLLSDAESRISGTPNQFDENTAEFDKLIKHLEVTVDDIVDADKIYTGINILLK